MARPDNLSGIQTTLAYDSPITREDVRAIDILDEGTLVVKDIEGNTLTYDFAAFVAAGGKYTTFPYRLNLRIREIVGDGSGSVGTAPTGTDIALADLVVLH